MRSGIQEALGDQVDPEAAGRLHVLQAVSWLGREALPLLQDLDHLRRLLADAGHLGGDELAPLLGRALHAAAESDAGALLVNRSAARVGLVVDGGQDDAVGSGSSQSP